MLGCGGTRAPRAGVEARVPLARRRDAHPSGDQPGRHSGPVPGRERYGKTSSARLVQRCSSQQRASSGWRTRRPAERTDPLSEQRQTRRHPEASRTPTRRHRRLAGPRRRPRLPGSTTGSTRTASSRCLRRPDGPRSGRQHPGHATTGRSTHHGHPPSKLPVDPLPPHLRSDGDRP
jgi:hypothetical protein